ncbi:hypothetical protein [Listeria booriae]|uniref:hypothetical protein n=1 Tax=Listeria booriae TaxID=1552123 RepID=UPI0016263086|nr:hypothetical protein [Listeria booriae]MBC1358747.1 hypothetical protein [Listeria booriae]
MKKIFVSVLSIMLPFSLFLSNHVQASETPNTESVTLDSDSYIIEQQGNTIKVTSASDDSETKVVFKNDYQSATVYEDGLTYEVTQDAAGSILVNGNMFLEKEESQPKLLKATSNSYKYVTTFKTKKSAYTKSGGLGIAAAGLLGGPAGTIATIAGIITSLGSFAKSNEIYIKIVQYYNSYTHMVRNTYYFYKNSNYTGLLKSYTAEQRLFS